MWLSVRLYVTELRLLVAADDGQRALAIQMAAYHARVAHNNCAVATPDTPRTAVAAPGRHVVVNTPSMHNCAAAAAAAAVVAPADVTAGCHGDNAAASDEQRSLLARYSVTDDVNRRRYQLQPDMQTV